MASAAKVAAQFWLDVFHNIRSAASAELDSLAVPDKAHYDKPAEGKIGLVLTLRNFRRAPGACAWKQGSLSGRKYLTGYVFY